MLLIRPLLQTNSERKHTIHVPIFFIFLVSNIGGCLTPLGDPPLFMGLIKGVPFFWTLRLFPLWAVMVAGVLLMFYLYDSLQYRKETSRDIIRDRQRVVPLRLTGTINFLWLAGVVAAIFLPFPSREGALIFMGILSLLTTKRACRIDNKFTYNPIIEVAVLFAGIFITMVPALLILNARGAELGITRPWQFFWATGSLSSFLDNTPTYLAFFSMAQGLGLNGEMMGIPGLMLKAISAGAVFMGANSYIGNGPNFMVKVIAEEYKLKMPSFFGYMAYSFAILIPLYVVVTLVFFR
jgi:Na+/H+ antiporter NhaD/arsenite permease-like protein